MASHQKLQVRSKKNNAILLESSWSLLNITSTGGPWQYIDLVFQHVSPSSSLAESLNNSDGCVIHLDNKTDPRRITHDSFNSPKAFEFLLQSLYSTAVPGLGVVRLVRLIVPLQKGHITRSDIIPLRLQDSQYVETAVSFAEPLVHYPGNPIASSVADNLPALFSAATAGLLLHHSVEHIPNVTLEALCSALDLELENRLSFPWILPGPVHRKTLVLVDANSAHPEDGLGLYRAATVLGIDLVVLDNAGHWLDGPEYAHLRDAFIPTRITNPPEDDVGERIVESVRAYGKPVDGIVTFADSFWPCIARIAPQLGLQTASPESLAIVVNKYQTSVFVGHQAYRASSLEEALDVEKNNDLPYPLIIKPCDGWSSKGVTRVESADALAAAVKSIDTSRHGTEFVMEKYCDGPELCDDLPKSADINGPTGGSITNFHELNSVYPSALPSHEIEVLRNSFLDTLLKLGLKNGIFHLEGRVESSSVIYKAQPDGTIDLSSQDIPTAKKPTAWLHEINPRPLGMTGSQIIESTYGIDYWGLALLIAVGDKARVRALSQPFKQGPQYTCIMVFIPADFPISCEGIFDSDDICADLLARRPDLAKQISRCACLVKQGQRVPHPTSGKHSVLAYFNVFSRQGRKEALALAKEVREEVRYSFI
ncbi:hypothetical protein PHISCL_07844 [Aspergillus sclerotialis]|uniref:ATP-grasp domain-containing protein n=1 Tax=Aspergillus sclerotialis TaxID=2070753 RepID=A0A3A2ZC09_9EURO|nr:hypothetical protein PHISCL_07844 [Aspergillus sclerotialis]